MEELKNSLLAAGTLLIFAIAPVYASGNSKVDFDKLRRENLDKHAILRP
jgi:hypothetical protein